MKLTNEHENSEKGSNNSNYYDELKSASDIGEVAQELIPDRITEESTETLHCDCPHHASISRTSLHIDLTKQLWNCFGCGVGGNVIQLVEFIQSGNVTKGIKGPQPVSHCSARDYLAQRANMPLLGKSDLTPEEIAAIELRNAVDSRTYECLTSATYFYNTQLVNNPEVVQWFMQNYAISEKTIDELKIGFAPVPDKSIGVVETLMSQGFTEEEILSTGAFPKSVHGPIPLFRGRITFPYWSRDKGVVYMIARKTPWTPHNEYESGKYKKLSVHSDRHSYVGECISNSNLYNEDCLIGRPLGIVIAEGITDAISLIERGFPTISPVTTRLKREDGLRLCDTLRGYLGKIIIVPDNEISQAGLQGALDTARILSRTGLDARIAELPLGDKQQQARGTVLENYGFDESTKVSADKDSKEQEQLADLLKDCKIDVNEFFLNGHSKEEFQSLLDKACTPLELSIKSLKPELTVVDRSKLLDPILLEISDLDPTQEEYYLKLVKEQLGDTSLQTLKKQLEKVEKENTVPSSGEEKVKFNKLLELFISSDCTVFLDQYDSGWVTVRVNNHYENVKITSEKFVRMMLKMYVREYKDPVGFDAIKLVGTYLAANAMEERNLYNRYAWKEDQLFIDTGSRDWKVIEVSEEGWKITQHEKPVFKRQSHQLPMPEPKTGGDIRKILKYLAVKDEGNQALLLVWLCTCMFEHIPRPGLVIQGIQGSAKTSTADILRRIVDPSKILHVSLSKDHTEFIQLMDHHAIVNLDNLSTIPAWASDALCGATTGAGFQKRMLYRDDDDITYCFKRVFVLNGILLPTIAPDLMDRAIILELTRISTKGRKQETRFLKAFRDDLPDILGGVLDVMVMVIARRHEELEEYPRLADWYGLGYIAADVLGVREDFVIAYKGAEKAQHSEVVESHDVSMLLVEFMEGKDNWDGTKNEIYAELSKMAEEKKIKKWPKTCSMFGKQLKTLYHNLEEMAFHCEDETDGFKRKFSISRKAPSESNDDDRHVSVIGDGSGSAVSAVSAVILPDINEMELTANHFCAVSVAVSAVSLPMDSGNLREIMKSPGFSIQLRCFSINYLPCGLPSTCIEACFRYRRWFRICCKCCKCCNIT